jgi:DNA-directed RNA polymerase specialized sigma subunit
MGGHSSISEFDAFPRDAALELLVQRITQLSATQKTVLATYYYESVEPIEIAACLGLTECETDQVRAETIGSLRTMLGTQIGLPELPASFDRPRDADGAGVVVNG